MSSDAPRRMVRRFRGFLPVVIDLETGGFNSATDALLQIAAVMVELDPAGQLRRAATHSFHVKPFAGANIEAASLQVNRIDPWHPLRPAVDERDALQRIFTEVRAAMRASQCHRAILVGHNAWFDLGFLKHVICTPQFHHWHHGIEKEAIDVNFAVHFPILDKVFGTHHLPGKNWPTGYGVGGHPVPDGYWRQMTYPLRGA